MVTSVSDSTIKVYNAALVRLGVPKIASFLDTSIAARTGNEMFEDVLEAAICMYPYRFSTRRVDLTRLSSDAPEPYEGLYQIPNVARHVWKVYEDGQQSTDFDVFERTVALNIPAEGKSVVSADVSVIVGPQAWPGYFRLPFITYLAANICMPITQDQRMADSLLSLGQQGLARAASRDSQSRTPPRVDTKLFIRQRRGGRR